MTDRVVVPSSGKTVRIEHFSRGVERPFTRGERDWVTCLFGGLTVRHERLIEASRGGMGYRAARIPTGTKADYRTGREYCSPGMCNPVYFTVGGLVNYLKRLRDVEGIPLQRILDEYVFVTAGSCGPCRFGMYESEFRLALLNSSFDGFRVIVIQQKGGLNQLEEGAGLEVNAEFVRRLVTALMIGDLINDIGHQVRPYEMVPGQTDRALDEAVERIGGVLGRAGAARSWWGVLCQTLGKGYGRILRECRGIIDEVEVDYMRPKPVCKITGEFWAQMTESDGNCRLFSFLEEQGAEVIVEPLTTWIVYLLDSAVRRKKESKLRGWKGSFVHEIRSRIVSFRDVMALKLASLLIRREYERMRQALGGLPRPLPRMSELRDLARPFFNDKISGGEGHMEVGKTLYYSVKRLSHIVLSVKPFGCLPSTQSDGVQGASLTHYARLGHHILFVPVETAGEGEIGVHSRVLMVIEEAKALCGREFEACLDSTRYAIEDIRAWRMQRHDLRRPFQTVPRREGVVGRAANFVYALSLRTDAGRYRDLRETCLAGMRPSESYSHQSETEWRK